MPSIAELKTQYPDLAALDDDQVVDAVHEAFYRDMPREDVAKSLGVKPAPALVEPRSMARVAGDVGISALKGAIAVPEAVVGVADLATGGRAGKLAEDAGFRPKEAKAMLDEGYSDQQKEAFRKVQAADGLGDTFMTAVQNPSVVAHSVVESLPSMGAGGVLARGGLALAPKLGAVTAAALGEGAVATGSAAEQIRQQTADGLLTGKQSLLAGATGAATTAFSMLGGKIAKKLGLADVDTMLAGASTYPAMRKGVVRSALEGAAAEGILEELPQSVSEQVLQNIALNRPLDEGVNQAAVLGLLSGAAMGGGANALNSFGGQPAPGVIPVEPAGPLARAAGAVAPGTAEAMAGPLPEPVDDPVADTIQALPDGIREQALRAYAVINNPDAAKGVRSYNQKLLDGLLDKVAGEVEIAQENAQKEPSALEGTAQAATKKIAPVTEVTDPETGEITTAYDQRQADAPKQEDGDILNAQNKPFTNMGAAKKTAAALGDGYVPIKLGTSAFVVRAKAADALAGDKIDKDWTAFASDSGTKGIPRADMPQIKAEHRGAMVNFLEARGVTAQQEEVAADTLKPTQAEFSTEKVKQAKDFIGGDRSILVSSDGHVLDGHHQWMAKREGNEPVKVIRLGAPIEQLIETVKEFPSAQTTTESQPTKAAQVDTSAAPESAAAANPANPDGTTGASDLRAGQPDAALNQPPALATQAQAAIKTVADDAQTEPARADEKPQAQAAAGQTGEAAPAAASGRPAAGAEAGDTAVQADGVDAEVKAIIDRRKATNSSGQNGEDEANIRAAILARNEKGPAPKNLSKEDAEHLFGVPQKRAAALDRIAAGKAWFGDSTKARAFLSKNGLKETHTFKQSKPGRFDIVEKEPKDAPAQAGKAPVAIETVADKGAALPNATAPEQVFTGVDDRELGQIVKEFNDAQASMLTDEEQVTHVFDAPKKGEVVRLEDKTRVYQKDKGWMTVPEAKAEIAKWKAHAQAQGADPATRSANADKIVLSLFDLSGEWSKPWEEAGYQVYRFDIQADPNMGDVNNFSSEFFGDWFGDFEGKDVYAILAANPCTDFAVSGARHFAAKDADGRTVASVKLVHQTLAAIEYFKPAVWGLENPVGRIEKLGGLPPWRLSFNPNHLGDPYTKKTLIWGRFNGDLPIAPVEPTEGSKMHKLYGGKSMATKNARSETPEGFSYGFFMANNAIDNPVMAVANKYDRLDAALIAKAIDAGVSEAQISEAVDDPYFMDLDDEAGNAAIQGLIDAAPPPAGKKTLPARIPGDFQSEADLAANRQMNAEIKADQQKDAGYKPPADVAKALTALGAKSNSTFKDTNWQLALDEFADVWVKFDPATNKATIKADYMGKVYDTREAEGAPAITAAIERARDGINAARLEMAKRVAATRVEAPPTRELPSLKNTLRQLKNSLAGDNAPNGNPWWKEPALRVSYEKSVAELEAKTGAAANTIFTEDAATKARAVLKAKLSGTLNSGIDPELLQAGLTLAGYHIEKGARTFTAYAKAMLADLGDGVKPYLKSWYMAVKYDPRAAAFEGMDDPSAMEAVDLDKLTGDADTGGPKDDGNATRQLDRTSPAALEGASTQDVRQTGEGRDAGNSTDGGSGSDLLGDARADDTGRVPDRGVGAGTGAVPVSARGTGTGGKTDKKPRVPRAPRPDAGAGLFGDAGGLTPEGGANPAPNAPAIAAPQVKAEDFTITDELALGEGGQKAKFRNNLAAIRLLADLEKTERLATPEEQAVLAKYVGWGGLPQAFDAGNADWAKEHAEITALMTPQELADARQSTRYAHYTSREIIVDGIYAAMRRFGFNGGKTLEAGAGVGNFMGLMPADMRSAGRFTAIEREPFSSAIARQLYPQQNVQRADFAEFRGTDAYYDAAVGNPPFASDPQTDRSGRKHLSGLSLHNYFFAKSVDMLREGGIMAQVITNAFMDAKTETARKYIGERTRLLGAIRLPNSAFAKNANTEVTTDIVFLQKLPDSEIGGRAARADAKRWLSIGQHKDARGKTVALNQYFIDNPDMMLGDFGAHGSMYGPDFPALVARPGQDTLALLKEAVGKLPEGVYKSIAETGTAEHTQAAITALRSPTVSEGGYFLDGDKLMQRLPDLAGEARGVQITPETQWTEKTKLGDTGFDRIKALAGLRGSVRGLIAAEMADDAKAMKDLRATLNQQYDAYRDTHGLINDPSTLRVFEDDPDFPLLASLEHGYTPGIGLAAAKRMGVKPTKSTAKKGPIFSQRVVAARQKVQKVDTPADALQVSMAERGKLDAGYIGELLGKEPEAVLKELSSGAAPLLFRDPATDEYVLRDAYLSGNVRAKLAQANAAGMFSNVTALEAVQPPEVASHEIVARLGSPWVPTSVYRDFAQTLFGEESNAVVTYLKANSSYQIYVTDASSVALTNTWGTPQYPGDKMLGALLNNRSIKVTYTDEKKATRTDVEATEMANTKAQEIKDKFADWLFSDPDRSELLTKAYNETNNNYVTRVYDGSHMSFLGKVPDSIIRFRKHQRNAIARIVQDRTALLDHVVGAGKTFTVVAGAMELKRTGLARKPMVAVPNHLVKQWAADFYRLYPGANVLTATKKDFEKANRRKFLARIATGDWDAVVIAHSSFGFIRPAPEFEADFNAEQVQQIMATIKAVDDSDGEKQTKKRTIKQLEAMKEKLENRIRSLRDKPMDDLLDFEQLGVDQLFVDEAHMFKNLMFSTKMQQVQGLGDSAGSQRAYDMYVKAHQIYAKNGRGQGVVFATGTPVSNSLAEMYHMMRYLMPVEMKALGFESFDAWANTFASVEQVWMQAPSGDGFKASNRMSNFVNTTELLKMFDQVSDTVTMDDIKKAYSEENDGAEFPLPKLKGGRRTPVSLDKSPAQDAYMLDIAKRAKEIEQRRGPPKKGDDNILVVMGDARKAAMDIRLVDSTVNEREKGGRIDTATDRVLERYQKYDKWKGTQIVFSDLGTPIKHAKAELKEYEALQARVAAGDEDTVARAALGDETAIDTMEDVEAAQAELEGKGKDWLSAVQAALRGFSVYDDFRAALVEKGVPDGEIAFIHDYNTDDQKATLFRKVNAGHIRVLLGSTQKLGAGTNVQERLVAEHHLDVPWRPSDVEQREGRIERQGNVLMTEIPGFEIEILAYVTKDTLDMRMWQVQENKLKMINQLRTRKVSREIDNAFEDMELSAGEMQAAATGDINLLNEIQLRSDVKKLEQKRRSFEAQRNDLITRKKRVAQNLRELPVKMERARAEAGQAQAYFADLRDNPPPFTMDIDGKTYTGVYEAQEYLRDKTDAKVESIDLAGEKTMKAAPIAIEINGELFKSRAAVAEMFSEVRGDAEPILWNFNGTDYRRRAKIATAIRQSVVDSIADETVKPVGTIAGYTVEVEGQVIKDGGMLVDVTMSRGGKVALSKQIVSENIAHTPDRVIRVVENLLASAVDEADYLERNLARAKKDAADLESVAEAGAWPEEGKLEAARAAHKEILGKLKQKDAAAQAAPAEDDVAFSRSAMPPAALKQAPTPAGTAFHNNEVVFGKPRLNVKQPSAGAVTRIDFELRDPVLFDKLRAAGTAAAAAREQSTVGILTMDMDKGGQFKSLRNIEIFESKRGDGLAEKVVGAIMATLPETAKLHVHDILPTAVGFWDKMGAKFARSEDYMEAFLTPAQYRSAYDARTSAAGAKGSGSEPGSTVFSRGRQSGSGADGITAAQAGASQTVEAQRATAEVERIVAGITSRWANSPNVVVAYDMNDPRIPERVRTQDQKQRSGGATGTPEGFFFKGTAYLMSSQVASQQDVARVLFHEALGHAGLRGNFGDELKPILAQVAALRRKDVAAKAAEYGLDMADEAQRLQAAEEVLAVMAQQTPEIGFVKRAIAIIRTWLRKNVPGFKNMKLTDADIIENYILPARGWVERGRADAAAPDMSTAFSRSNGDVGKAFNALVKQSPDVDGLLFNWNESELNEDRDTIVRFPGRDSFVSRGQNGGKVTVSKREFLDWLNSDAPFDAKVYGPTVAPEWREQVEAARAVIAPIYGATQGLATASSRPAQTGTPAFKKWFSDSKVVDADGKPLVVYHGTNKNFTEFKLSNGMVMFSPDRKYAEQLAGKDGRVIEAYLSVQKPEMDVDLDFFEASRLYGEEVARMKRAGADGAWSNDREQIAVFDPKQIKSATDNNGDFNPGSDDIRFSRSLPAAMASAMNSAHDVKLPAGYVVHDFFKADGKLSWWHKSVGTQYNLAQRSPVFKKVFDRTQDFINDVSFYATDAADLAPSILPKLETWKDIAKTSITAADNKAIAAPIFEGTLVWMRDAKGKPVPAADVEAAAATMSADDKAQRLFREDKISEGVLKMWRGLPIEQYEALVNGKYERDMLKPGIVFTPAELRDLYKLTDQQIALYGEFRAAVDKSLTNMAVADMVRFGGADVAAVRDQALAMGDVDAAAVLLRDHLLDQAEGSERAGVLVDTAEKMIDKADKARDLMDRGYAPLSRFGSYSLDVVDQNGERVYFGLFESKAEANRMARQMRGNFPKATINQGTMSDEEYKLFAGVTPETIELFGEMLGLESEGSEASNQAFQQYLKLAKANRSAMKRLIQRKGIAGFSEDPGRVLAGFVYSNARQTSSGLHMGGISEAVRDIPKGQGELKDAAVRLMDYVKNPQEEAQKIRGLLFAQYLGGSIASAMVNLMQPVNVTFPWLSQHGGIVKAAGQMKNAVADALKKSTGDATLDAALKKAAEDGIVSPQEVFQLMAQAQGKATLKPGDGTRMGDAVATAENALSKMSLAWGKVFGLAEQFNRRTTFIAAYRTAVEQKMADPAAFAERAVNETQFVYNKGAKPRWARGAVGGILFTFKSYSINYVEMLSRMAASGPEGRKAALLALGVLFLMSGAGGLPFAEDIEDVLDGLMQRLGYNFSSKQAKQEFLIGLMGRPGAQFVERGISGLAGVPIDVSGRLGMGNLLPGTGLLTKKQDHGRDLMELAGPAGDLAKRTVEAAGKLVDGNILGRTGAVATLSPTALRNMIQANDMATTGLYRDTKGKKVLDVDAYDVMAKAIGFQPNDVARVQEATGQVINMVGQNKMRESEIADMWAQGVFEGDTAKVERARNALKRWNEANPTAPIKIQMPQIIKRVKAMREDKATRIARTAPKEIRASVRRELAAEAD
ncbi:PLxRFG domain-containing protein [Polaromonas sp.]|uniref:PLxRFG domain-containing protein n=1 Tax=Polaromonas sp. TaxID=1869339 RepID=UPI0032632AA3